ncbi:hypothetical protein LMJ53_15285 [Rheinheimera sp. UJ51]|uniref:hypothetical protein n=1 Tax=unclassified Rheinheimera TaxID=115860 RepID=UPI001E52BB0C|nr:MULTISPECIES: hypothetical protein [unclassified Rheinheimera]MCC5453085.1 hypothetical protein [Rheinheimera sp. UJ51]MCF4010448.1 hypothetical protein [Rheinheimera sp. UJ63]
MFDSSFRQQAAAWQRQFQLQHRGSFLQRVLAWLVLGVMLMVGAFLLLFALVLSWVLIPILIFRHRQRMRKFREQAGQYQQQQQSHTRSGGQVIEGEVIHKDDTDPR